MLYLIRGSDGSVQTVSKEALPGSVPVEDQSPEVLKFFKSSSTSSFNDADADFVRVLEDLIDMLIVKNIIRHTDLPAAAQKKLLLRKGMRSRLTGALDFMGSENRIL
jgi:hypothetical protein